MKWSYKTVHFEMKKEGILGSGFLDESEIEQELNEYGLSGWELVSVLEVHDGVIAFFKQPFGSVRAVTMSAQADAEEEREAQRLQERADAVEAVASAVSETTEETDAEAVDNDSGIGAIRIE